MKYIYESFTEIANDICDGDKLAHICSKHSSDECLGWQKGVREFAAYLDKAGIKIVQNPEVFDKIWEFQ